MIFAAFGNYDLAVRIKKALAQRGHEVKYFVHLSPQPQDFDSVKNFETVSFFELRHIHLKHKIDGIIVAGTDMPRATIEYFKVHDMPRLGFLHFSSNSSFSVQWISNEKGFLSYLETNLIDSCNLNCKRCTHFAPLFDDSSFYNPNNFKNDLRELSAKFDVLKFRLMGGEPFKLNNLADYLELARFYFPDTDIRLVSNGLLVPSVSDSVLKAVKKYGIKVDVTLYPPTYKIREKLGEVFKAQGISYYFVSAGSTIIENFTYFLTLKGDKNPNEARKHCMNDVCRFLRNGKLYKCAVDALSYKPAERFRTEAFPRAVGVDLYAANAVELARQLDGNVELCHYCSESVKTAPWEVTNSPKLEDWLA